jgi:hypothetical protein
MNEWIRVEDKLPTIEGKVLIAFIEQFFGMLTQEIETGYYDEESAAWRFWFPDKEVIGGGVTHWAILPELPEYKFVRKEVYSDHGGFVNSQHEKFKTK